MAITTSPAERQQSGADYASAVSQWLIPAPGMRSGQSRSLEDGLDALLSQSDSLRVTAATGLTTGDPLETAAAEVQLLAGMALDLLVAGRLAAPEPGPRSLSAAPSSISDLAGDLAELRAMIAAPQAYLIGATALQAAPTGSRRSMRGRSLRAADRQSEEAAAAIHAAIGTIRSSAITAGSGIVEGMLLIDFKTLRAAVGMVGGDLAKELGADLAQIGGRALDFILIANEKILTLTGLNALTEAQRAAQKLLAGWVEQLRNGVLVARLTERVLGTKGIETETKGWLAAYQGADEVLFRVRDEVNRLAGQYAAKARVVQKVNAGLGLVKLAPPLRTPVGSAALGVVYLGLLAYVVGSAYDHVDSDKIALLDRVEGVRGVAQRALTGVAPQPSTNPDHE